MSEEILSLSTIVEKATVNIASKLHPRGKLYELVDLDDLGPIEHQKIVVKHAEAAQLLESPKELTEAESRKLGKLLGDVVKILLPSIETKVLNELSNAKRSTILRVWAARQQTASTASDDTPRSRRTTAASSRRSKSSTAATRKRGSTPRRG